MSAATYRQKSTTAESGSGKVLEFPANRRGQTQAYSDIDQMDALLGNPDFAERLVQLLEAGMYAKFVRSIELQQLAISNPFDAIYLSKLIPDPVDHNTRVQMERFAEIRDLSDEFEIDDEWN